MDFSVLNPDGVQGTGKRSKNRKKKDRAASSGGGGQGESKSQEPDAVPAARAAAPRLLELPLDGRRKANASVVELAGAAVDAAAIDAAALTYGTLPLPASDASARVEGHCISCSSTGVTGRPAAFASSNCDRRR